MRRVECGKDSFRPSSWSNVWCYVIVLHRKSIFATATITLISCTYCTNNIVHCNRIPVLAKMPNNRRITKKTIKGKEGLHPGSRKAAQLTRVQLRVEKLKGNNKARKDHVAARGTSPDGELDALTC